MFIDKIYSSKTRHARIPPHVTLETDAEDIPPSKSYHG
jgi:hypothetical protein